jgi:SAM-dependent methyltransferase
MPNTDDNTNRGQIEYWNSAATLPWVALEDRLDALFAALTQVTLSHAATRAGEWVIDIGCGCGATVLELASRVGSGGHVLGIDVSAPMLGRARERANAAGFDQATLVLADMSSYAFSPGDFDLAFSRFGVMFFADPVAAFTNLRAALKPCGRLVFACFRSATENPWTLEPYKAVKHLLPPTAMPGPEDPGQFAFADPDRVRRILEGAGFTDVTFAKHDPIMRMAGPGGAAEAAAFASQIGPAARGLQGAPDSLRAAVRDAYERVFREHDGPDGIVFTGGLWIVSAHA